MIICSVTAFKAGVLQINLICSSVSFPALLFLFCVTLNKSPLLLLDSDGRLPVQLGDGVIADLVAAWSNIPYLESKEEFQLIMVTDNYMYMLFLVVL